MTHRTPRESDERTPAGRRRRILLTGASGVVGAPLLARLRGMEVTCLVHRSAVPGHHVRAVHGDVSAPRLGLSAAQYSALAGRVDAVVHCAAVTDFNRTDGSLEATNIVGVEQVAAFARAAEATLYHVSTAFVHTQAQGERSQTALGYARSKRAGEDIVRASGTRNVILRPSIVIGDSRTGQVASFQGLYGVAAALLRGLVPMVPFDPSWPLDFVPADVVADAIATVVEQDVTSGEFWISAGERALRLREAVAICVELGRELGLAVDDPRFVPPDLFDRLIGPVFLDALPAKVRSTVLRMLEFFAAYLASGQALPSSLPELAALGATGLPDQRESLRTSLEHWAMSTGAARGRRSGSVAA